jgi:cell volume regulation protein A
VSFPLHWPTLLGMKVPGAHMIASVTLIAVLMTILIQAPTRKWLAGQLGLLEVRQKRPPR